MDESLQETEAELKALKPRRLSSRLTNRVANELTAQAMVAQADSTKNPRGVPAAHFIAWRSLSVGALGLAASLAVVTAVLHGPRNSAVARPYVPGPAAKSNGSASDDAYKPIAASNVLYEMKDEGPAIVAGDSSDRRVRYRYVDTYTWKNPRNNASLTWRVPRDEIRVQPAQFN
jgi:hypothetical protein